MHPRNYSGSVFEIVVDRPEARGGAETTLALSLTKGISAVALNISCVPLAEVLSLSLL